MADNDKKKSGKLKLILIVFIVFVVAPFTAVFGFYKFNDQFRLSANKVLSSVPGPIGSYFDGFPTAEETGEKIKQIAEYLLDIDNNRAVDKLTILKGEDENSYKEIIKIMLRINPNATKNILEEIRDSNIKKDVILSTLDKINEEKSQEIQSEADYLSELSLPTAIEEINYILSSSVNGHRDLAYIIDVMDVEKAATLMEKIDIEDYNKIMGFLTSNKVSLIRTEIADSKVRKNELQSISDIYVTEDIDKLATIIGDETNYPINELSLIYKNLGPIKSGKVLSKVNNDDFIFRLMSTIKENEIMNNGSDEITQDILKSLKIYKEFDDNVLELSNVYAKMSSDKVAEIIKKMIRNSSSPKEYELSSGEKIVITDEYLALEIMKHFNQKKIADILSYLDNILSSEISRKMTLPKI